MLDDVTGALRLVSSDILEDPHGRAEKATLYGAEAVEAEIERRRALRLQVVDLRGDDLPPPKDEWERARAEKRDKFDPVREAGITVAYPRLGDAVDEQLRRRTQSRASEQQKTRWAVAAGVTLTLASGRKLLQLEPIELDDIGAGQHSMEALKSLVARGAVTEIDRNEALKRSAPAWVGPYIVLESFIADDGRSFAAGDSISERDYPRPPATREFAEHDPVASMTVGELDRHIRTLLNRHGLIGGATLAPPVSIIDAWLSIGRIARATNYDAKATAPSSDSKPPPKRGVLARLVPRRRESK